MSTESGGDHRFCVGTDGEGWSGREAPAQDWKRQADMTGSALKNLSAVIGEVNGLLGVKEADVQGQLNAPL